MTTGAYTALTDVCFHVSSGEWVTIVGPSGSGKSTLMHILGFLDQPTSGTYSFNGEQLIEKNLSERANLRNRMIGFIFQSFYLLPMMSALDNVALPLLYAGVPTSQRQRRALELMDAVGMGDFAEHTPQRLSGGQQQRIAIARALICNPNLILADEPTGALDTKTSQDVLDLLSTLHKEKGVTIVMITHDQAVAKWADRVVTLNAGRITN